MVGYFYEVYGHVPQIPESRWWYECTACFIALLTLTAERNMDMAKDSQTLLAKYPSLPLASECAENPDKDLRTHLWAFQPTEDFHPAEVQREYPAYIYCVHCHIIVPIKKDDVMNFWLKPVEVQDDDNE